MLLKELYPMMASTANVNVYDSVTGKVIFRSHNVKKETLKSFEDCEVCPSSVEPMFSITKEKDIVTPAIKFGIIRKD